jgi:hypothetical protein
MYLLMLVLFDVHVVVRLAKSCPLQPERQFAWLFGVFYGNKVMYLSMLLCLRLFQACMYDAWVGSCMLCMLTWRWNVCFNLAYAVSQLVVARDIEGDFACNSYAAQRPADRERTQHLAGPTLDYAGGHPWDTCLFSTTLCFVRCTVYPFSHHIFSPGHLHLASA